MLPEIKYLAWARDRFPRAQWDLASSGVAPVSSLKLSRLEALADPQGPALFAREIARRYGVAPDHAIAALGGSGGISMVAGALLNPGDKVLVEEPCYEPLSEVIRARGAVLQRFNRGLEARFELRTHDVETVLDPSTKLLVVSNPHNPSGLCADIHVISELAALMARNGGWILVDEVYRELQAPRTTAYGKAENIIVVSSLTKCFGFGWMRAGWVFAHRAVVAELDRSLTHAVGILPTTVGALGCAALDCVDALAEQTSSRVERNRAMVDAFLQTHASVLSWNPPPKGSLFGFVRDLRGGPVTEMLERGLRDWGVLAVPGAFFGEPSHFRLSWGIETSRLGEALTRLGRALKVDPA